VISNRLLASLLTGIFLVFVTAPAGALSARATADVDLQARLKEVEREPKLHESMLKLGGKVASICDHCHGVGGNSPQPNIPNLASQNPVYHLDQLRKYANGQRRDEFMERMIKVMNADEKVGMVLFYAHQAVTRKPVSNAALVARGKTLYTKACIGCHDATGHGDETLARIAGQQPVYLSASLKRYRGESGERLDRDMAKSTKPMTDADIDALVAFMMAMQ
jgi:cytochrome c553